MAMCSRTSSGRSACSHNPRRGAYAAALGDWRDAFLPFGLRRGLLIGNHPERLADAQKRTAVRFCFFQQRGATRQPQVLLRPANREIEVLGNPLDVNAVRQCMLGKLQQPADADGMADSVDGALRRRLEFLPDESGKLVQIQRRFFDRPAPGRPPSAARWGESALSMSALIGVISVVMMKNILGVQIIIPAAALAACSGA